MQSPVGVENTEKLIEALGYWPSFHDAEIIEISAIRAMAGEPAATSARLRVSICEYKEIDAGTATYEMVCSKNLLIDFLFYDLHYLCFEDFNHQNVVDAIAFNLLENQLIEVTVASIFGIGGVIRCARVEVGDVTSQL
jgi:hypothetical protein